MITAGVVSSDAQDISRPSEWLIKVKSTTEPNAPFDLAIVSQYDARRSPKRPKENSPILWTMHCNHRQWLFGSVLLGPKPISPTCPRFQLTSGSYRLPSTFLYGLVTACPQRRPHYRLVYPYTIVRISIVCRWSPRAGLEQPCSERLRLIIFPLHLAPFWIQNNCRFREYACCPGPSFASYATNWGSVSPSRAMLPRPKSCAFCALFSRLPTSTSIRDKLTSTSC